MPRPAKSFRLGTDRIKLSVFFLDTDGRQIKVKNHHKIVIICWTNTSLRGSASVSQITGTPVMGFKTVLPRGIALFVVLVMVFIRNSRPFPAQTGRDPC